MNKIRQQIIENNEISEVYEVNLGGYPQKIMIDGKSKKNPIVICLHGGPGTPIPFSVGCRGMFPEITEQVTLVCWDQLGCGINNYKINDTFQIKDFVAMTADVVSEIHHRFPDNKKFIFGMSWGSILTLKVLSQIESMIDGVITYGQVLHHLAFNDEVYAALEHAAMPEKKKRLLNKMKDEPTIDNVRRLMSWIRKYTLGYTGKSTETEPMGNIIKGYLTSPDYKLRDCKAIILNGYMRNKSLLEELINVDVRTELLEVHIPYTIIQGSLDIVTPTQSVKDVLANCDNSQIRLVVVEDNGHIPNAKGMSTILDEIVIMSKSV